MCFFVPVEILARGVKNFWSSCTATSYDSAQKETPQDSPRNGNFSFTPFDDLMSFYLVLLKAFWILKMLFAFGGISQGRFTQRLPTWRDVDRSGLLPRGTQPGGGRGNPSRNHGRQEVVTDPQVRDHQVHDETLLIMIQFQRRQFLLVLLADSPYS